jgi:hypothetical protein
MADYYKATSWGRTRRPKTLAKRDHTVATKETPVEVTVVTTGSGLVDALNAIALPQCNGYATENQRYLHVYVADPVGSAADSIQIYGYNYAFGKWAPILEEDGDGTRSIMTATCGGSGAARHYIFDIAGIDRVGFVSADAPSDIFAACTTF